jgi:Rhodopirellula transposase DDE domain
MPSSTIETKDAAARTSGHVKRLSIDWKATVPMGARSRGGRTRGAHHACEHALGSQEKDIPGGMVDEDTGQLSLMFGSAYQTSACIVAVLAARWNAVEAPEQGAVELLQIKMDNGSASNAIRPQFVHRMVQFADAIAQPIQLLYSPPDHSKYNPIERCWGLLELHGNGTKLIDVETMLEWAKSMTWQGMHPVVELSRQAYQKGIALRKRAMRAVEKRLERHPQLPKWDILIRPASAW